MKKFQTKHGELTIQFFYHEIIDSRLIELRTATEQIAFMRCADHNVQSFITKADNDKEQGMKDFWVAVFRRFNEAVTAKFKDEDEGFETVEELLNSGLEGVKWNGSGFEQ